VPHPTSAPAQAERRQLTVMFCDLVGSTALSTGMDPEDLRDVIASYQNRCSAAIRRYDGFVRGMHLLPKRGGKPEWQHTQDYWTEKDEFPAVDLTGPEFAYR
jgi:hypothetical protein